MKIRLITILVIIGALYLSIVPAFAFDSPLNGSVIDSSGLVQQQMYYGTAGSTGSHTVNQIWVNDFSFFEAGNTLDAVKYSLIYGSSCGNGWTIANWTTNSSIVPMTLYDGTIPVGTGVFGYDVATASCPSLNVYAFILSWNTSYAATGTKYFTINYDLSKFDLRANVFAAYNTSNVYSAGFGSVSADQWGGSSLMANAEVDYHSSFNVIYNVTKAYPIISQNQYETNPYYSGISYKAMSILQEYNSATGNWDEVGNVTSTNKTDLYGSALKSSRFIIRDPFTGFSQYLLYNGNTSQRCNFTATVQNYNGGNAISGSTFWVWDYNSGGVESFYLPYGTGTISIPDTLHIYGFNASKTGYTGTAPMPTASQATPATCEAWQFSPVYAHLIGPPTSATNGTLQVYVHNTDQYPLPISGAIITLSDGHTGVTDDSGSYTFYLLVPSLMYNYSVTRTGYLGVSGDQLVSSGMNFLDITLSTGTAPIATITPTPSPTCASGDINCQVAAAFTFVGNGIQFIVSIGYYIILLTLIWMFMYAASGEIPGYKRRGGGGTGLIKNVGRLWK